MPRISEPPPVECNTSASSPPRMGSGTSDGLVGFEGQSSSTRSTKSWVSLLDRSLRSRQRALAISSLTYPQVLGLHLSLYQPSTSNGEATLAHPLTICPSASWRSGLFLGFWLDSPYLSNHTSLPDIHTCLLVRISTPVWCYTGPPAVAERSATTHELVEFNNTWNLWLEP